MGILKRSPEALRKAASILRRGGVIVCPTDTVYGLLADAVNKKAVDKIFKIKKRLKSKPLPVFVKDLKMAKEIAEIDVKQEKILKRYWPGKYTFILKSKIKNKKLKIFSVARDTIAIRIPKHKFLNDLLKKINRPLAQTSVNISTRPPLTDARDIMAQFNKNKLINLIIDEGKLEKSKPSKIIDLASEKLTRLR